MKSDVTKMRVCSDKSNIKQRVGWQVIFTHEAHLQRLVYMIKPEVRWINLRQTALSLSISYHYLITNVTRIQWYIEWEWFKLKHVVVGFVCVKKHVFSFLGSRYSICSFFSTLSLPPQGLVLGHLSPFTISLLLHGVVIPKYLLPFIK